jgi:hypothetical protein
MTSLIISLNLTGGMSSEYEPTSETVSPLRVSVELARRVVLRAAMHMYSLLSWTVCWMLAVVKRSSDKPVLYRVSESETVEVSETVFADDVPPCISAHSNLCSLLWILACSFVDSHRHALQHWEMSVDGNCWHWQREWGAVWGTVGSLWSMGCEGSASCDL